VGGGDTGGSSSLSVSYAQNGYTSYGTGDYSTYQASGYDTDSSGSTSGTSSGYTTFTSTDGTEHFSANVPSISQNQINFTSISGAYLQSGTNTLPAGVTLVEDTTSSTATFTDSLGRQWTLTGVLDSDGHNVDITFSATGIGQWTQQFDANAWAPTELASTATSSTAAITVQSDRHTMWSWGDTAAVAGAVAGVATAVAAIAAVIPGGQGVAGAAGVVAGVTGAVAGVAACLDHFTSAKKKT
jgi:hypothetical protein